MSKTQAYEAPPALMIKLDPARPNRVPVAIDDHGIRYTGRELCDPIPAPTEDEIEELAAWLRPRVRPASTRLDMSSYGFKHRYVENAGYGYVTNGCLIAALSRLGIKQSREGANSPNTNIFAKFDS